MIKRPALQGNESEGNERLTANQRRDVLPYVQSNEFLKLNAASEPAESPLNQHCVETEMARGERLDRFQ